MKQNICQIRQIKMELSPQKRGSN